ncbi:hypothetical protein Ancab_005651, partial [Ancistrocladus abbreviatus]
IDKGKIQPSQRTVYPLVRPKVLEDYAPWMLIQRPQWRQGKKLPSQGCKQRHNDPMVLTPITKGEDVFYRGTPGGS